MSMASKTASYRSLVPGQFFSRQLPFANNFRVKSIRLETCGGEDIAVVEVTDWMGRALRTQRVYANSLVFVSPQ